MTREQLAQALDEAREVAQEYYTDLRRELGDYMWEKHYAHDRELPDRTWLKAPSYWNGKEWVAGSEIEAEATAAEGG